MILGECKFIYMCFILFSSDDSGGVCNGVRFLLGFDCGHSLHRVWFPWFWPHDTFSSCITVIVPLLFIPGSHVPLWLLCVALQSHDLSGCLAVCSIIGWPWVSFIIAWLCQSVATGQSIPCRSTVSVMFHHWNGLGCCMAVYWSLNHFTPYHSCIDPVCSLFHSSDV